MCAIIRAVTKGWGLGNYPSYYGGYFETKPLEGKKYIKQKASCPPATFYFPCLLEKLVTTLYYKKSTIGVQKFHVDDNYRQPKLSNEISVSSVTLHMRVVKSNQLQAKITGHFIIVDGFSTELFF